MSSSDSDRTLDEWKEARSVLARFDTNLHDLRKVGFTFVTALLAANGLLSQNLTGATSVVPDGVKAGVLVATMGLIVALKLLDTHYRLFQQAASVRGRILEDRLNLDITNDISLFYDYRKYWWYVQVLYYSFVGLTVLLGFAILWGDTLLIATMLVAALVSGVLIHVIDQEKPTAFEDWSVDKKIVSKGTPVRITYTNLNSRDVAPGTFRLWWNVKHESAKAGTTPLPEGSPENVQLKYLESRDWLCQTDKLEPDLYELAMWSARVQGEGTVASTAVDKPEAGKPSYQSTIQVTPPPPATGLCPKCGAMNPPTSKYCSQCATKL